MSLRVLVVVAVAGAFRGGFGPRLGARPSLGRCALRAAEQPSLNQQINALGLSLKAKGIAQKEKMLAATSRVEQGKRLVAAGLLFGVFVAYRAYRGFFVVLPAVFGEVREKVRSGIVEKYGVDADVDPATGRARFRSTALMNVGAAVFTAVLLVRTCFDGLAVVLSKLGSGALVSSGDGANAKAPTLEEKAAALDLPPLPDIPDVALPETDELPPTSCCD